MRDNSCRLTAEFSGRGLTCQHAGEHFMVSGPLQRFVRRHGADASLGSVERHHTQISGATFSPRFGQEMAK